MAEVVVKAANSMYTGQVGFVATLRVEQFSGFEFFLLPSRVHARLVVATEGSVETHLPVAQPLDIAFLKFYKFPDT